MVEHLVWDQGVAGSNPVFPINKNRRRNHSDGFCVYFVYLEILPFLVFQYIMRDILNNPVGNVGECAVVGGLESGPKGLSASLTTLSEMPSDSPFYLTVMCE